MICRFLRKRRKQYVYHTYCTIKRQNVELDDCKNCVQKEFKKMYGLKPVSKKRATVSKQTYSIVMERDKRCRLCGRWDGLQLHHILYRSERKDLIDEPKNCIMLCHQCHAVVHSNKHKYQPMLQKMIDNS